MVTVRCPWRLRHCCPCSRRCLLTVKLLESMRVMEKGMLMVSVTGQGGCKVRWVLVAQLAAVCRERPLSLRPHSREHNSTALRCLTLQLLLTELVACGRRKQKMKTLTLPTCTPFDAVKLECGRRGGAWPLALQGACSHLQSILHLRLHIHLGCRIHPLRSLARHHIVIA